ncbi:MAG TPA: sensor histidine kinase [Terriglobia bacterium]|jgi:signal transduction histidine kinase
MTNTIIQKFKDWQERRQIPAAPLRAELFREVLIVAAVTLFAQGTFLKLAGIPWIGHGPRGLLFMTLQPAAWLLGAMLCHRAARNPKLMGAARAYLFVGVVETVTLATVGFPYAQYGAVMVLTIVLAGLFISREYVIAWTLAACGVQLSQMDYVNWNWNQYAAWCVVYLTAGWLVTLFAKHLESLFESNRIAEERQRSAIVAERTRFARDIHDTLAQGLTGIMMQLNAAEQRMEESSGSVRSCIEKARQLATESLEEARRSVSALRAGALGNGTLLDAIAQIGNKLLADSSVKLETRLEGQPYSLAESCENNLLRIAQEALTNAVRHAEASSIFIFLAYRTGSVHLEIGDSGRGMSGGEPAGFGVDGMRERARQMGGEIKILSDPGRGTRILVTVPNA